MVDQLTIGGIPIPSNAPLFLGVLFVHVAAGLTSVGAGAVAAMSAKRAPRHPRVGAVYFWALVVAVLSMFILSVSRWSGTAYSSSSAWRRSRPLSSLEARFDDTAGQS